MMESWFIVQNHPGFQKLQALLWGHNPCQGSWHAGIHLKKDGL
jgi:hypothetical protein